MFKTLYLIPLAAMIMSCWGAAQQLRSPVFRPASYQAACCIPWADVRAAYLITQTPTETFYTYLKRMRKKYRHGHTAAIDYIHNYAHLAYKVELAFGISADLVLAVGMLESGLGQSSIAKCGYNHFGMKKGSHQGVVFLCGQNIEWRAYDNAAQSYFDFAAAVSANYPQVAACPTPEVFAATGWAGDDHAGYQRQLEQLIRRYELTLLFSQKIYMTNDL